jgi:hypothetical protein
MGNAGSAESTVCKKGLCKRIMSACDDEVGVMSVTSLFVLMPCTLLQDKLKFGGKRSSRSGKNGAINQGWKNVDPMLRSMIVDYYSQQNINVSNLP